MRSGAMAHQEDAFRIKTKCVCICAQIGKCSGNVGCLSRRIGLGYKTIVERRKGIAILREMACFGASAGGLVSPGPAAAMNEDKQGRFAT